MHVSCVMPTTSRRRWCLPWAVEYFLDQRYHAAELVIVDDGEESVEDLVPEHPRIRYVHFGQRLPLGEKYNRCVELAAYDWIALWADDDWHAPHRLRYTMTMLAKDPAKEIAGLRRMLFHQMGTDRTYLCSYPNDTDPYFLGGSVIFHRRYWQRHGFDGTAKRRADASFTNDIDPAEYARVATVLQDERFYVAMNHTDNTGRDGSVDPAGERWSRWDGSLLELMGSKIARRYL
jgi:glycosyltransferase involved in cell wall biosynthesis